MHQQANMEKVASPSFTCNWQRLFFFFESIDKDSIEESASGSFSDKAQKQAHKRGNSNQLAGQEKTLTSSSQIAPPAQRSQQQFNTPGTPAHPPILVTLHYPPASFSMQKHIRSAIGIANSCKTQQSHRKNCIRDWELDKKTDQSQHPAGVH